MGAILRARDKDGNVYDIPAIRGAQGPVGPQGPKGDTGSGFKVLDYYDTLEALEAAVTAPSAGDVYGVGTGAPYDIYIYSLTQGWVNNGQLQGPAGYTPVRGTDYWTAADQQAVIDAVLSALPAAEGVNV